MYDLGYFRANFDRIAERLQTRANPPNLEGFRELDANRRAAIAESEQLKASRNVETAEIGRLCQLRKSRGGTKCSIWWPSCSNASS